MVDRELFLTEDWWDANKAVVKALIRLERDLTPREIGAFRERLNLVREDEIWDQYISPEEMGSAYEKCADFVDSATYYEAHLPEKWAREGWLRVKEAQKQYHLERGQKEIAEKIAERIDKNRSEWSKR